MRRGQRCGAVWPVYPAFRWGGTDLWAWICTATMPDQRPENGHGTDGTDVIDFAPRMRAHARAYAKAFTSVPDVPPIQK